MKRSSGSLGGGRQSLGAQRVKRESSASRPSSTQSHLATGSTRLTMGPGMKWGASVGRASLSSNSHGKGLGKQTPSSAMKQRMTGFRGGADIKEQRPVTEKTYKDRSIRLLVEFLTEHGYPDPITVKALSCPQKKDFVKVFEFLYGFLESGFKLGPKIEEEVPKLLKNIGYPVAISRSSMQAVGTPHTWPAILAALTWLREMIQYSKGLDIESVLFPDADDFDSIPERKLLFGYVEHTYREFMKGKDDFGDDLEALAARMKQNGPTGELERLSSDHRILTQEYQALTEEPDSLLRLRETVASMHQDVESLEEYLRKLENHNKQQEQKLSHLDNDQRALELEVTGLEEKQKEMQYIYSTQKLSKADVERINMDREELQRQMESLEHENEDIDKQIWKQEIVIQKKQERLEAKCQEYNTIAQNLKLIPPMAENAFGIDFEMRATYQSYGSDDVDFVTTIKPALIRIKSQHKTQTRKTYHSLLEFNEGLDQVSDMVGEKKQNLESLKNQLKIQEQSLECSKEIYQKEEELIQKKLQSLQKEVLELESQMALGGDQREERVVDAQARLNAIRTKTKKEEIKYNSFMLRLGGMMVDHKTRIQEHCQQFKEKHEELLVQTMKWTPKEKDSV